MFWLRVIALAAVCGSCSFLSLGQSLQAQPASIAAGSAGFTSQAHILFENNGAEKVEQVALTYFSNDGITATIGPPDAADAPPQGEIDWAVNLTVPSSAHVPGTIVFQATYRSAGIVRNLYTSVAIQSDGSQKAVDATLDGTPDPVSWQRPSAINLMVTNNLDVPVTVSAKPQTLFGGLQIPPIATFQVQPRSVGAQRVSLTTGFRVTPGNQLAVIDVDVRWTRDNQTSQRHFALAKSVTVGVFFESELLKSLSIPSFLALPGCLVLFTMQLLLSSGWLGLKNQSNIPNLAVTTPGFWILSLSISGLFVAIYYGITGVNCLLSYGSGDLAIIWVASIVVGAMLYLGIGLHRREWLKKHVHQSSDTPLEVLQKMANNKIGPLRPRVKFKIGNGELTGYAIENIDEDQTVVWVAPRIAVIWQDGKSQTEQEAFKNIMDNSRDPGKLAKLLSEAGDLAEMHFAAGESVPRPYHLKLDAITGYLPDDLIIG